MLTRDFKQDAYRYRPGIPRQQPLNNAVQRKKMYEWYGQPSTNRMIEDAYGICIDGGPEEHKMRVKEQQMRQYEERARASYQQHAKESTVGPPASQEAFHSIKASIDSAKSPDVPLARRLQPWQAEAKGIKDGTIASLRPRKRRTPSINTQSAASPQLPDTNPILYPPGDPRGGYAIQKSMEDQRRAILLEAIRNTQLEPLEDPPTPPPAELSPPTSPPVAGTSSPVYGLSPTMGPVTSPKSPPSRFSADDKLRQTLGLPPRIRLASEYDFYKVQAETAGIAPRQFYHPDVQEPFVDPASLTGFSLFKLEFRAMWNKEHPELSDSIYTQQDKAKQNLPLVSPHLLAARRQQIGKAAAKEWEALSGEEQAPFEQRATEMAEPRPPTVAEQLSNTNYTWSEMNSSREWFFNGAEPQIETLKSKLAVLDQELTTMTMDSRNIAALVIDDYIPGHVAKTKKKQPEESQHQKRQKEIEEEEEAKLIRDLNNSIRNPVQKQKEKIKKVAIWQGAAGDHIEMLRKKKPKGVRRSSLSVCDPTWQFKHQTSMFNAGVKASGKRRSSVEAGINDDAELARKALSSFGAVTQEEHAEAALPRGDLGTAGLDAVSPQSENNDSD